MTEILTTETLTIGRESDLAELSSTVREFANRVLMNRLAQTKLSTATSELARNMLIYANGGQVQLETVRRAAQKGVRMTFSDTGPGITNIDLAMQKGYSTGGSLGLGLPGAKQLSDEFSLTSTANAGTTIIILHWANE